MGEDREKERRESRKGKGGGEGWRVVGEDEYKREGEGGGEKKTRIREGGRRTEGWIERGIFRGEGHLHD